MSELNTVLNPFDTLLYNSKILAYARLLHFNLGELLIDIIQVCDGGTAVSNYYQNGDLIISDTKILLNKLKPRDKIKKNISADEENFQSKGLKSFKFISRPGIFDYITLGIFRLIHALATFFGRVLSLDTKQFKGAKKGGIYLSKAAAFIPFIIFGLAHVIGNGIIRHAFSLLMTIACLPIILPIYGIMRLATKIIGNNLAKKIDVTIPNSTTPVKLNTVLNKTKLNNARICQKYKEENSVSVYIMNMEELYPIKLSTDDRLFKKLCLTNRSAYSELIPQDHLCRRPRHRL